MLWKYGYILKMASGFVVEGQGMKGRLKESCKRQMREDFRMVDFCMEDTHSDQCWLLALIRLPLSLGECRPSQLLGILLDLKPCSLFFSPMSSLIFWIPPIIHDNIFLFS